MTQLTLLNLKIAAAQFVKAMSGTPIPDLFGSTDGKAVGTYVEQAFNHYLRATYNYLPGNAALGIDFPDLSVDLKVTSIRQPQSSCPFRDASQKVYGLGYHLLVFTYEKFDDTTTRTTRLDFRDAIFVTREKTGDYQTTYGLIGILNRKGNKDDIIAYLEERNLPLDEIGRNLLAEQILEFPPQLGYLTISNALQWRLQYSRIIDVANSKTDMGVENLLV
ncbi:restriction endonuclease [Fischerella major NIES-592]|uniref:Restriction endonuclease n=1 Tax=Fischerella major NIES-592 TaxID=210994 RepID=A0A1U7GWB5_9CYAN|nr:restriction endonuclease [Fischerella major]OKH12536.1 restriction endonuclease [Fischerella major NIES-592]